MTSAFQIGSFAFGREARLGKRTLAISSADATKVNESSTKATFVPNQPATNPPIAAPRVNIADQVTDAIALAGSNSRSETIDGMPAVLAGSKKAENANCITVRTYTNHIRSSRQTNS